MKALITGITGQDGSYLAELLLAKGYEVHGVMRRSSSFTTGRINHILDQLHLHYGDMTDGAALGRLLREVEPTEVYNLAAQSHVKVSFDQPVYTAEVGAIGTLRLLEALRTLPHPPRLYHASTSEMFGDARPLQNELTPFAPRSPYAAAKVFAHQLAGVYRDAYGLHISCGILFNHESPRRGATFVTRKVTRAAARIALGLQEELLLGNLDARRDWGHARDYVQAMWRMVGRPEGGDFIIATGRSYSVRDLCRVAFGCVGLDWAKYVRVDERYLRPLDVEDLCGDPTQARRALDWQATTTFEELIREMVEHDLEAEDVRHYSVTVPPLERVIVRPTEEIGGIFEAESIDEGGEV